MEGPAIIFGKTKYYMYLFGRKFTLRTGHKPMLKLTLLHPFWKPHAFSISPYSSLHTSAKLTSSLQLKWPAPMHCPDYHCNTGRMPASRPNLPGVSGATKQTHFAVLEIVHKTVRNPVLAMIQMVGLTTSAPLLSSSHSYLLRLSSLSSKAAWCEACEPSYLPPYGSRF